MAMQVGMNTDRIRELSQRVYAYAEEFGALIGSMDNVTTESMNEWYGSANDAFVAQWQEFKPKLEVMRENMVIVSGQMTKSANSYDELDTQNSGMFGFR